MCRPGTIRLAAAILSMLAISGCGHFGSAPPSGGSNTAPVTLTLRDSPPLNTTVLSFQVAIKSAILQPGNVQLIKSPQTLDLTQLQTDTTFLSTATVPAGNYTSITLDFENPLLTFINNTGGPITPTQGKTCLASAICQTVPVIFTSNIVTITTAPFPLRININSPVGLEVDMDLADLIQPDFSMNLFSSGALNVIELPSVSGSAEQLQLDHIFGTVKTLGTNQFTFTAANGALLTINVDSNTTFSFPGCAANNFSCLQANQVLELSLSLLGNGSLLAKEVDLEDTAGTQDVTGTVVSVGSGSPPTSFQMLVHQATPGAGVAVADLVDVTIQSTAKFSVDNHSFTLPSGLTFTGGSSLLIGQEVLVRVVGSVTAGPPISFATNLVALRRSQITAVVFSVNSGANSFVLDDLPSLFVKASPTPILELTVQTTSQTNFEDLNPNSISGVVVGNFISVGGFLFNTGTTPTVVPDKVRGQPFPGA